MVKQNMPTKKLENKKKIAEHVNYHNKLAFKMVTYQTETKKKSSYLHKVGMAAAKYTCW
jgi:hypothetical protein